MTASPTAIIALPAFFLLTSASTGALARDTAPQVAAQQLGTSRNLPVCAAGVIQSPL